MPQQLDDTPTQLVRDLLFDNWTASEANSYDVSIADPDDPNFLPLTTNWGPGEVWPIITVTNNSMSPLGGGTTGWTSIQGDGSGVNQDRQETMLLTIRAEGETDYNGEDAEEIVDTLSSHCEDILQENAAGGGVPDAYSVNLLSSDTVAQEDGDAVTLWQYQSEVAFTWTSTPS